MNYCKLSKKNKAVYLFHVNSKGVEFMSGPLGLMGYGG